MFSFRSLLVLAALIALPSLASAQEEVDPAASDDFITDPNDSGVVYRKKTEYDFEDDVVEGSFVRPEGDYLSARRRARHSSLIRIRENFVPEMLKSAEDI